MLVNAGFINAFGAILATGLIIALIGLPIGITAARYGLDMDLLTRGAGFSYIGSTVYLADLRHIHLPYFCAGSGHLSAYALELGFRFRLGAI